VRGGSIPALGASPFDKRMKITYDDEANASYIYFTSIEAGGVTETAPFVEMSVELDENNQIAILRICENEDCKFQNRLKYVLQHPHVSYDEAPRSIIISFASVPEPKNVIAWDGNVDLDDEGQILGLEILFAHPDYRPDDGQERLYAEGKLKHLSKYIVPFDQLH